MASGSGSEIEEEAQSSSCLTTDDVDASSCTDTNQTESSSSGVNSLLSKLRTPLPSDLARKRRVRTNPPTGVKRGKGAVAARIIFRRLCRIISRASI